jgi:saccharopine dehydrogenase-like NADP-dependent oxidoreductase
MASEKVRVVALGGCGGMGQFAVRTALSYDFVDEIVIADRDGARAQSFAEQCGSKASAVEIDVQDSEGLVGLLRDRDILLTTVGPYYRFGVPILRSAIEARCHYIDICDDWEPTLEMLDLDREAREAGVTALVGVGASPGISNLLAVKAMSLLDTVEELVTGWGLGDSRSGEPEAAGEGGSYGAAIEHWVHQFTGKIRLYRGGQLIDVSPLEEVQLDFPGTGRVSAHTVGHPEPITLPRFRPEIRNSCNVMDLSPETIVMLRWLAAKVNGGRVSIPDAADWLLDVVTSGSVGWKDLFFSTLGPKYFWTALREKMRGKRNHPSSIFALAIGQREGKRTTVGVAPTSAPAGGMGGATGVPMAVALAMFARGQVERHGVFAPEAIIQPDPFFDELAPLCTPPRTNVKELLQITTYP